MMLTVRWQQVAGDDAGAHRIHHQIISIVIEPATRLRDDAAFIGKTTPARRKLAGVHPIASRHRIWP
jgi:hypothetical protein